MSSPGEPGNKLLASIVDLISGIRPFLRSESVAHVLLKVFAVYKLVKMYGGEYLFECALEPGEYGIKTMRSDACVDTVVRGRRTRIFVEVQLNSDWKSVAFTIAKTGERDLAPEGVDVVWLVVAPGRFIPKIASYLAENRVKARVVFWGAERLAEEMLSLTLVDLGMSRQTLLRGWYRRKNDGGIKQ